MTWFIVRLLLQVCNYTKYKVVLNRVFPPDTPNDYILTAIFSSPASSWCCRKQKHQQHRQPRHQHHTQNNISTTSISIAVGVTHHHSFSDKLQSFSIHTWRHINQSGNRPTRNCDLKPTLVPMTRIRPKPHCRIVHRSRKSPRLQLEIVGFTVKPLPCAWAANMAKINYCRQHQSHTPSGNYPVHRIFRFLFSPSVSPSVNLPSVLAVENRTIGNLRTARISDN